MLRADGQQVLVLSPHPDDETFGCGGTLRLLASAGAEIDVLYMTRGELGVDAPESSTPASRERLATLRSTEAHAACQLLGAREVNFLAGRDGQLCEQPELATDIAAQLGRHGYSRVFCPWSEESHPDHRATCHLLKWALGGFSGTLDVWLYEVWTPLRPAVYVPIDATIEAKLAAAQCHQSQLACLDYVSGFRGLAAYRALACAGAKFAEAFQTCDARRFVAGNGHA
ncbi:MAG: PIG-L deacetylase family protein [Pirellulaceae bacterium]|nr:PIG-L deacetylase family protein [Pirellulaceae bacterium]